MSDRRITRRSFLASSCATLAGGLAGGLGGCASMEEILQQYYREHTPEERKQVLVRLEKEYEQKYGKKFTISDAPALDNTLFAYGLDISRCIGCRRCVYACVGENNQSRDPQIHWIRVLEMEKKLGIDLLESDPYYNAETVPRPGHFYMPVACQQCRKPACTKVCPVSATWTDPDGIVVIDYNWCIGCRYCMAACPYGARHFNWGKPQIPSNEVNPVTHYLGNRPRTLGVVEKCTFCIQRTRKGLYPSCVEICPVGARKFGNLLDPNSEIRYLIDHKRVYILKEELGTEPKFYYFYGV